METAASRTVILYTIPTDEGKVKKLAAFMDGYTISKQGSEYKQHISDTVHQVQLQYISSTATQSRYNIENFEMIMTQIRCLAAQSGGVERFMWVGHGKPGRIRATDIICNGTKVNEGNINLVQIAQLIAATRVSRIHINACEFGCRYESATNNEWNQTEGVRYLTQEIARAGNNRFTITANNTTVMCNVPVERKDKSRSGDIDAFFNPKYGQPYYQYGESQPNQYEILKYTVEK